MVVVIRTFVKSNDGGRSSSEVLNRDIPWGSEMGKLTVLLSWKCGYLPDAAERRWNRLIHEQFQDNPNPYIDYLDLVDAVWTKELHLAPGTRRVREFPFAKLKLVDSQGSEWCSNNENPCQRKAGKGVGVEPRCR